MKIIIKNSTMVFQKTNIIEKSATKAFSQGGSDNLQITLDTPVSANEQVEMTVTGDLGVVSFNKWSLLVNGAQQSDTQTIYTNGDPLVFTKDYIINSVGISRASIAGNGTITLSVKYMGSES